MSLRLKQRLDRLRAVYKAIQANAESGLSIARRAETARIVSDQRYQSYDRLVRFGYKIYSQNDEDGILAEIFRRIGVTSRYFVEFGIGNGLENNSLALLLQDWRGLWIEGNPTSCSTIATGLSKTIGSGQLTVKNAFISRDNIDDLISSASPPEAVDLLSIDVDGNDYYLWKAIHCIKPRVVVMEYNAKFPPPVEYCMQYDVAHVWDGTDNYGASLSFLSKRFTSDEYSLVGCDLTGTNAFFVRNDCVGNSFAAPFTAEFHYEPTRYELVGVPSGHPASFCTIENRATPLRQPVEMSLSTDVG